MAHPRLLDYSKIPGLPAESLDIGGNPVVNPGLIWGTGYPKYFHTGTHYFPPVSTPLNNLLKLQAYDKDHGQRRLKTLDTIGNCQRPVYSLGVSQHMHKITNL